MKRIVSILLILCMMISFAGCNKEEKESKSKKNSENTTAISSDDSGNTKEESKDKEKEESTKEETRGSETTKESDSTTKKNESSVTTTTTTAKATTTTTKKTSSKNVIKNNLMSSFSTLDMDGNTVTQAILKGKEVTMFNVWWTQCSPCIAEMPDLASLNSKYSNFQVIGIVWDYTNTSSVNSIISQTGANYTHIQMDNGIYSKVMTAGYEGYVPFTFFVDEDGNQLKFTLDGQLVSYASGAQDWEPIIKELLG